MSFRPMRTTRCGSSCSATRSSRFARFDVATQRSLGALDAVDVTMLEPTASDRAHFTAYLPPATWFLLVEPNELAEEGKFYLDRMERPQAFHSVRTTLEEIYKFPSVTAAGVPAGSMETTAHLQFESVERFSGDIAKVRDELDKVSVGQEVFVVCETDAEVERLGEVFKATPLLAEGRLHFVGGHLEAGFRIVPQKVVLVSAAELFQRQDLVADDAAAAGAGDRQLPRSCAKAISSSTWRTASAATAGCELLEKDGRRRRAPGARVPGGTKIYVPSAQDRAGAEVRRRAKGEADAGEDRRRGVGAAEEGGGAGRHRSGGRDARAAGGPRGSRPGIAFPADTRVAARVRRRVSLPGNARPAHGDRRDQGATCSSRGRWTGCCAATSASARPSWRFARRSRRSTPATRSRCSCRRRCSPSSIAARSRRGWRSFRSRSRRSRGSARPKEQREILERPADGQLDILIGTHRLASPDVKFQNLGLLIIDEEQRFGVEVKERLKALRATRRRAHDDGDADSADAAHVAAWACGHLESGDAAGGPAGGRDAGHAVRATS